MDIAKIKEVSKSADDPVWVDDSVHGLTGVSLCVYSRNSMRSQRSIGRIVRGLGEDARDEDGNLLDEMQDEVEDMSLLNALADWKGLTAEGKPFPFSGDAARDLCTSTVFWNALRASVTHVTIQSNKALEALEKN